MKLQRLRDHLLAPGTLAACWALLALAWLASLQGLDNPWLGRLLALGSLAVTTAFLLRQAWHLLRAEQRPWGPLFLGLVGVAIGVGFTGLGHEVGTGYYTDEGHYLHHARRVASGELFTGSMIYPHFLYYFDAFALWLSGLFPGATRALAQGLYGVDQPYEIPWLVLRWAGAGLAVSAVIPVALVARKLGGTLGGLAGGGAMVFASQYHLGFQVNTCDVPSAAFAAWCLYFVARIQEDETPRLYAATGVMAGLAAATKYPAGVVAIAIVAVWLVHRARKRDLRWGLVLAGAAALAVFLALNPSFFVYPEATLYGKRGLFFGVRQYAGGGWIGVMPSSKVEYYGQQLGINFGLPILALALLGLLGLGSRDRWRWVGLTVFPLMYLALISSMSMVVVRNLFPALPGFAMLLGAGLGGWWLLLRGRASGVRTALASALLLMAWWSPARTTLEQTAALRLPSTREAMTRWIQQNVPRGAGILKESYTPNFSPEWYRVREQRFAIKFPAARFEDPSFDYLLLAGQAHGRFFRPEHQTYSQADWYRGVFERFPLVHEESVGDGRLGPHLYLLLLDREPRPVGFRRFEAREAFVTQAIMRKEGEGSLVFQRPSHQAIFYEELEAGRYQVTAFSAADTIQEGIRIQVRDLSGREVVTLLPDSESREVALPASGKHFFTLSLPPGGELHSLLLESVP